MFLTYVDFIKLPIRSGASRFSNRFTNTFCLQKKLKYFSLRLKSKAGRAVSGKIIFWTRGRLLKRFKSIKTNVHLRYNRLCFIASFQFIPFTNKLLSLFYYTNGIISYYICTENHILFDYYYYYYYYSNKKIIKYLPKLPWNLILLIKKLTFICFIELFPGRGAQYSLSAGTKSKLLFADSRSKGAYVQLPSKTHKFFSIYSLVFSGQIALSENKKFHNTKAGYWRSFGWKPVVRGVAMNPVDHPHGGRTKAVRYQRTPWGKTTKLK